MPKSPPDIEELRKIIDQKDSEIFNLLSQRTDLVVEIGRLKKKNKDYTNKISFRPAREAKIIRNLMEKRTDNILPSMIISIWREMLSSACALQSDFSIGYWGESEPDHVRDMIRYYYGHCVSIKRYKNIFELLDKLEKEEVNIAVVPAPDLACGEQKNWWQNIPENKKVVGMLPFVKSDPAISIKGNYYIISDAPIESTGNDLFMMKVKSKSDFSSTDIITLLTNIGFEAKSLAFCDNKISQPKYHLIEVKGYINPDILDSLNNKITEISKGNIISSKILGQYPAPYDLNQENNNKMNDVLPFTDLTTLI